MKTLPFILTLLILYGNACCKETEYEGFKHDDTSNLTSENGNVSLFNNLIRTQHFTMGTLLGLLVACIVVVIGSFLVLYRLCCDVEMVVTREAMEPLHSISQKVSNSPKTSANRTVSKKKLLRQGCSSSVLEIV